MDNTLFDIEEYTDPKCAASCRATPAAIAPIGE